VQPRNAEALPIGHTLEGYRIERVLRTSGFTITYLVVEPTGHKLALREYFPASSALRMRDGLRLSPKPGSSAEFAAGLERFRTNAKMARALHYPGFVPAVDYFEEGGTGYLISEFVAGETLAARLARVGTLPEREVIGLIPPLLDAIEALNEAGFAHGDVQPDTILLRAGDDLPMLLDLGATRHALALAATSTEPPDWGYAAPDQGRGAAPTDGAWADTYGLAATLYRCISGTRPIDAAERVAAIGAGGPDPLLPAVSAGRGRYSRQLLEAIDAALIVSAEARRPSGSPARAMLRRLAGRQRWRPLMTGLRSVVASVQTRRRSYIGASALALAALAVFVLYHATTPSPESERAFASPVSDTVLARHAGTVFRDCPACPRMVVIPAGQFTMGAVTDDPDAVPTEKPQRSVTIARPFALAKYEVTVGEYAACVADGACPNRGDQAPWGGGRFPAVKAEWRDAKAYAAWLSATTGKAYRLPSEAEWEYAARAGSRTRYHWGNRAGRNRANCQDCGSIWDGRQAAPVGSFLANRFGLHDMLGNVWEWTEDCWSPTLADVPENGSARPGPAFCPGRALRGGSFDLPAQRARVTSRTAADAEVGEIFIGFRVARSLDEARAAAR
jgi:formylglycine-generating enzyme required for sulfatase activity